MPPRAPHSDHNGRPFVETVAEGQPAKKTALDRTFQASVALKGLDGVLELLGGVLLLLVSPDRINSIVQFLTQHELAEDPNDFVANHLVNAANNLTSAATIFGAIYLLAHGLIKVVLVVAVLRDTLWAYPWMIAFLIAFIAFQIYQIATTISVGLIALTLFDGFIVVLTVIEYRRRRKRPRRSHAHEEPKRGPLAN